MTLDFQNHRLAKNGIISVLALVFLSFSAYSINSGRAWINRPFAGFTVRDNNVVPVAALPSWEGFKRGIKFGDVVVAVNGKPVSTGDAFNKYMGSLKPGILANYTIQRREDRLVIAVPVSLFTLRDYLEFFPLVIFLGLVYYAFGLVVFYLKPNSPVSWAFLFNSVGGGFTLAATPGFCADHSNTLHLYLLPLIGPSFMAISLYFPEVNRVKRYLLPLGFGLCLPIMIAYVHFFHDIPKFQATDQIMLIFNGLCIFLGFYLMGRSFYKSADRLTRQKAKVVIYALSLSFCCAMSFYIGTVILKENLFTWFLFAGLGIIPISIGYAILVDNLFDVDVMIRRSVGYIVVSAIVVPLLFVLMGLISFFLQDLTGESSQMAAVFSTLMVAAAFRPLHARINHQIDRWFYREGYEYQRTLRDAGKMLARIIDLDELVRKVLDTIMDAVKIEAGAVFILDAEDGRFKIKARRLLYAGTEAGSNGRSGPSVQSIEAGHPLARRLEYTERPLQLNTTTVVSPPADQEAILELMSGLGAALAIPIIFEFKLIAILLLGPRFSGTGYSTEDVDLIHTLMIQTAVSIENARKVRELRKMVELEASYRELKALDELKDEFLSMVSHDLRSPMTGIKGYALVLRDLVEDDQQKQYLDVIIEQGERLTRLINDLLDFQRFEAGRMELEFEDLDLAAVLNESFDTFTGANFDKPLALEKFIAPGPIMVRGHRDRLAQAVENLLSNAVKFTPGNGRVTLGLKVVKEGERAEAMVSVHDTGPGVAPEVQPQLFQRFTQTGHGPRQEQQGGGLGLALARQIIENHGGRVGVKSEAGKGSEFYFLLPLATGPGN